MSCEMYGSTCGLHFGFNRKEERERQDKALAELSPEHRELLMALEALAWRCYDRLTCWCPMWGAIKEFTPELVARVIEASVVVGLSEQECSYWYNWIARGANKAMPCMSTYHTPIHTSVYITPKTGAGGSYTTFEQDYRIRIPPHDGEVIGLLMVRAGLEWLEHLKSQGKL